MPKKTEQRNTSHNRSMNVSASTSEFREGKIRLPKV